MSRLSELVAFKEYWENRREKAVEAVKFYSNEITKEVSKTKDVDTIKNMGMNNLKGKLVEFKSNVYKNKTYLGYVSKVDGYIVVYYSNSKSSPINISDSRILNVWEVINWDDEKSKEENIMNSTVGIENYLNGKTIASDTRLGTTTITVKEELPSPMMYTHKEWEESYELGYKDGQTDMLDRVAKRNPFTFSDFDNSVKRTWKKQDFKDAVSNASLGLTGEAGEVADLIKKAIYHGRGFKKDFPLSVSKRERAISSVDVKDELSDTLFYVSAMAQEFGFTLEEVARHNKEKLEKRYKEGFTVEESAMKMDKHSNAHVSTMLGGTCNDN
ncbi:hypothetical protein BC7_00059 [Bacillus phage BC-7]|nr:hypothetical protein BC7_00059 [Bacillus phage BC-7]